MEAKLKIATNVAVLVMVVSWLAFVAHVYLRDRKEKPLDVLISTVHAPRED